MSVHEEREEIREAGAEPPAEEPRRRRRPKGRTVLLGALALFVTAVLLTAGAGYWAYQHYTGRVQRIPQTFPTNAPVPAASKGGQNFLLMGLDSRSDVPTTGSDARGSSGATATSAVTR
ncbi:hypothetical protein AB6O49_31865 [Streptomyces sp. SBR177]